ncbi:MAG: prepilin-type N-terminal cleavage/methylation domain-containing protein, partial [Planctomycetota bacterium]
MSTGIRFIVEGPSTRPRRRALTLAEVLIAMGVLAIGLLGVAAVFPVGGFYMQSGDIADRAGMVAQLALEDAIIRGHLDPENWLAHDADVYSPTFSLADPNNGLLCRPLQQVLRRSLASATAPVLPPGANGTVEQYRATFYGGAYAIDPIGFGAALADRESGLFND